MNGDKYKPILEQAEKAESDDERINSILTMLEMIGLNHLPSIEKKIVLIKNANKKIYRIIIMIGIAILLAILFQDQLSLTKIVSIIGRFL